MAFGASNDGFAIRRLEFMINLARAAVGLRRRTAGWTLLALGLVIAPAVAVAVFLGASAITSALPALQAAGLAALFGVEFALGWLALAVLRSTGPRTRAAVL